MRVGTHEMTEPPTRKQTNNKNNRRHRITDDTNASKCTEIEEKSAGGPTHKNPGTKCEKPGKDPANKPEAHPRAPQPA